MVDYADIGKRIRACRLAKGMTQEQLANEVGVVVKIGRASCRERVSSPV